MRCPECQKHVAPFGHWQSQIHGEDLSHSLTFLKVGELIDIAAPLWFWRNNDAPEKCFHCWTRLEPNRWTRWWSFVGFLASLALGCWAAWALWERWDAFGNAAEFRAAASAAIGTALVTFVVAFYAVLYIRWLTGWYRPDVPATQDAEKIRRLIRSTPPRCFRRLKVEPAPVPADNGWSNDLIATWKLVCPCGSGEGTVLVVPQSGYEEDLLFVSLLSFQCARCGAASEFLDTDADGVQAELTRLMGPAPDERDASGKRTSMTGMEAAALIHGHDIEAPAVRGEGPGVPFPCPRCGLSRGEVVVVLNIYRERYAPVLEQDGIYPRWENLFNAAEVYSRCSGCGEQSLVAEIQSEYGDF